MDKNGKWLVKFTLATWLILMTNIIGWSIVSILPTVISFSLAVTIIIVDTMLLLSFLAAGEKS